METRKTMVIQDNKSASGTHRERLTVTATSSPHHDMIMYEAEYIRYVKDTDNTFYRMLWYVFSDDLLETA